MTFVDDARLRRLVALAAEPEVIGGRFELGALLGEGGMGVVYEAWDRNGQRSVALKVLRDVDEAMSARFDREAEALAALSHPGIVAYVAHGGTAAGERYLAMEQLVGVTLAARLAHGPLRVQDAARVGHAVAAALAAAHGHDLVHRDIKPSNIFLEGRDPARVKLLDFGLARGKDAPALTRAGSLVGTPSYMAPEQVRGSAPHGPQGDLFALGAVLFECLTGRPPFVGADTEGVLVKILVERPPAVRELCASVPPAFDTLIGRLLSKDPGHRPADAAEVVRELAALLAQQHADTAPAAVAGDPVQAGALIAGKYRVVRALGSGGMGIVLLARHETLDRNVAIKLLHPSGDEANSGVARLVREARAVSQLESEHVARVMDVGMLEDGAPFIVMEFLSGRDLAQLLRERKRLPVDVVVDYVLQAAEAIAEAHALGIVHRDLKPSNMFLTTRRDGSPLVKVLDFGISKMAASSGAARTGLLPSEASITAPDAIVGSPLYMSPEQLESAKRVDARTDIWSLGVVIQELLTGRRPFEADSFMAIGARIAAGTPAELREGCPEAPEGLAAIVRRCLEKDPARRFSSIAELAHALGPYAPETSRLSIERITRVAGGVIAGEAATSLSQNAGAPARRRGVLLAGGAVAAVALGTALLAVRRVPVEEGARGPLSPTQVTSGATAALSTPAATTPDAGVSAGMRPSQPGPPSMAGQPGRAQPSPSAQPSASLSAARPSSRVSSSAAAPQTTPVVKGRRPATPVVPGARAPGKPPPRDVLDAMNPALIRR